MGVIIVLENLLIILLKQCIIYIEDIVRTDRGDLMLIPEYKGVCDVEKIFRFYFKTLTNKVCNLIQFDNLTDHIDEEYLKEQLVLEGRVCFTEFNHNLYACKGNPGGEPNVYYLPTLFVIANPVLGSKQVTIRNKDGSTDVSGLTGILVGLSHADLELEGDIHGGLYDLIYTYSGLLADNLVSLNCAQINSRVQVAYVGDTEALANTAEKVLKDLYNGTPYKVLSQDILNKLTVNPVTSSGANTTIMSLIEAHAQIISDFYSELGISYNSNRKREYVSQTENSMDTGSLNLNIDTIINSIKDGIDQVNELFGTDIKVHLDENAYENVMNASLDTDSVDGIIDRNDDTIDDKMSDPLDEKEGDEDVQE